MKRTMKVLALVLLVALVGAACSKKANTAGPKVKVGLVYDTTGVGDKSFNDAAHAGLIKAEGELNLDVKELTPTSGGENRGELLQLLSTQGYQLNIAVGFLFVQSVCQTALTFPAIKYAVVDGFIDHTACDGAADLTDASNITSLLFAEEQGSYLVGAAAALKSTTGHIGFIGGVEIDLIKKFEAGFVAGAQKIKPDIKVDVKYITQPPDFTGFNDPAKGKEIATGLYEGGADVVYHAAGGSGTGLFEAARDYSAANSHVWAIGVDADQYLSAAADLQPFILTSMLKHVEVAVHAAIKDDVDGTLKGGIRVFDLKVDGVGYATSGGFIDDIKSQLDDLKAQIIAGTIVVPTAPA